MTQKMNPVYAKRLLSHRIGTALSVAGMSLGPAHATSTRTRRVTRGRITW